ncbi:olfactory receptor 10G4-like [Thalassophryne amazonica]|uniref:olfactory receptor 10G4-like n=1 Tax=Thalassophryne amazonica TaxID=390379 RepID=UPI00147223C0|nr:olfactory receptor 10G4-like [Thalassophryne amazonica]
MNSSCNLSMLEAQSQMNDTIYHLIKLVSTCVSCSLNTLLSAPLLLVISRSPSLLRHTRFLLLTNLLLCINLQQLLWMIKAILLNSNESMPAAQCLIFLTAIQMCSMVDLFLSTALSVDRFVAVRWPLRYEFLVCPQRRKAAVAGIWMLPAVFSTAALGMNLSTVQVDFSILRCRPLIFTPCLSWTLAVVLTVGTAVVIPLCYLTILGCFCFLCWDMRAGLSCASRACVTLSLQAAQTLLFSVPLLMDTYLLPGYLHSDALDIATTITYDLGITLIPLAYGYRSRELQRRIRQAAHRNTANNQNEL